MVRHAQRHDSPCFVFPTEPRHAAPSFLRTAAATKETHTHNHSTHDLASCRTQLRPERMKNRCAPPE